MIVDAGLVDIDRRGKEETVIPARLFFYIPDEEVRDFFAILRNDAVARRGNEDS